MSANVIMPQLGETVAEGKILSWFKAAGDEVREGDRLFEVETDKVTVEVEAISAGFLSEIFVHDGEVAKVGAVVAVIRDDSEKPLRPDVDPVSSQDGSAISRSPFEEVVTSPGWFGPAKASNGVRVTPLARRLIAQNNLDLEAIAQNVAGRKGMRIAERDVREAIASKAHPTAANPDTGKLVPAQRPGTAQGDVVTLNTIRQRTGERLAENWRTIPHVFQAIDIDFTKIEAARSKHKENFRRATGMALTYLPFIARAVCIALKAFPQINARLDGTALTLCNEVNLGIAVDLSHNGLVVPVVHNADDLTLAGLAKAIGRRVEKARAGKSTGDDFAGGTYSISNNGAFGTMFTAPIINAPQVAILSTDAIRKRPAIVETPEGDFIAPRLIGVVGQSFDHRAFDGAYSAAFLARLKQIAEERSWDEELAPVR